MAGVYVSGTGRGGCRKPALYPLLLEASSVPISQLGDLDFYLDFSVESISQVAEDALPTPPLGTSGVAADTALRLPAAQPPTHPFPSTSDTTAGTSPQLPAVLPRGEIIDDSHKDGDVEKHVLARLREFLHGVQGLL
ncbi:hypothetical protein Prudu_020316 [Prunus dulcis]|uniref:Uncharacterized protein n=1 Tax=Prunus dulcis TaxID=3755 RepID=A0A4Y1RWS9_PRUDU|nr:hypothetical protein Prudu_020316 [Prunus dulcis]